MRIGVGCQPGLLSSAPPGLDYFESPVGEALCPFDDEDSFRARLDVLKTVPVPLESVNWLFPPEVKTVGPTVDDAMLDKYMRVVCRRAAQAGVKVVIYGSGHSRRAPNGVKLMDAVGQLVDQLRRWGPMAADNGLVIVLEHVDRSITNVVTSLEEGGVVVRQVNHPGVRLLCDIYHMVRDGEKPQAIGPVGNLIAHAHCADGHRMAPPSAAGENHYMYYRALKAAGYDGRVTIQAAWRSFHEQLPSAVAELRRQIESA